MEHFTFHSREREDGQVDHHDNQFPIDRNPAGFPGCVENHEKRSEEELPPQFFLLMGQSPNAIFDNDNGAVHDEPKSSAPRLIRLALT